MPNCAMCTIYELAINLSHIMYFPSKSCHRACGRGQAPLYPPHQNELVQQELSCPLVNILITINKQKSTLFCVVPDSKQDRHIGVTNRNGEICDTNKIIHACHIVEECYHECTNLSFAI